MPAWGMIFTQAVGMQLPVSTDSAEAEELLRVARRLAVVDRARFSSITKSPMA